MHYLILIVGGVCKYYLQTGCVLVREVVLGLYDLSVIYTAHQKSIHPRISC